MGVGARRRRLLRDAALPRERAECWPSRRRSRAARPRRSRAASRRAASSPTSAATASRSSTTSGSPLAYIMDTPARPDDADNPLRSPTATRGRASTSTRSRERFGCRVVDGYGASEVGVSFSAQRRRPAGALGRPGPRRQDPRRGRRASARRALRRATGGSANAEEAIGEIVNTAGSGMFEGYYKNDEATRGAHARRPLLHRRPRLPRRRRLRLLRRPRRSSGSASTARTSSRGRSRRSCSATGRVPVARSTACPMRRPAIA